MSAARSGNKPQVGGTYDRARELLAAGQTQTQVAHTLGVTRQYVHRVAKGKARCVS